MPFSQEVWDRIMASTGDIKWHESYPDKWIDAFVCDGGQVDRKGRPDRIVFYISLCTTREMRYYVRSIQELGGWYVPFVVTNEYDGFQARYTWKL
jgi:cytolysin (calcineurin-like family phosphatase)